MERISIKNISKSFRASSDKRKTALERVVSRLPPEQSKETLAVLRGISFSAEAGDIVGIIGKNGSGKSTLLRIIAGIIEKDTGTIMINGKLVSFLSFDAGMKGRLPMQENIFLFCTLLGMSKEEVRRKFNAIVAFAELEEFVYTEWYRFSDGMRQRAVLATVLHTQPEILLLDEAFSSVDRRFRKKSVEKIQELARGGSTIVLASHELPILEYCCNKILWLDGGVIRSAGESATVVSEYRNYEW